MVIRLNQIAPLPLKWLHAVGFLLGCLTFLSLLSAEQPVDAVSRIRNHIQVVKTDSGTAPTWSDTLEFMHSQGIDPNRDLEATDLIEIFTTLRDLQHPLVSPSDLTELIKAKRDSIHSLKAYVSLRREYFGENQPERRLPPKDEYEIAFSGEKWYFRHKEEKSKNQYGADGITTLCERTLRCVDALDAPRPIGRIYNDDSGQSMFYNLPGNFLRECMLIDSKVWGHEGPTYDLVRFIQSAIVFEAPQSVVGRDCLLASNGSMRVFLDPEINFAIIRYEERWGVESLSPHVTRAYEDFQDCGNGVWLPRRVVKSQFDKKQREVFRETFQITDLVVNKRLPDDFFTDIFPDGTRVVDEIRGLTYIAGEHGSIAQILKGATPELLTKPDRGRRLWLIIGNAVVLIVVFCLYLYRKTRSSNTGT